jgi:ankyrin repeat protein
MVRCVLEQGANPNAIAKHEQESPLMVAVRLPGGARIATALLEFGADPNRMVDGFTVLTHAAASGPVANVWAILKSPKTLIDKPNGEDETPLGFAIVWQHHAMIEELLRCGASPHARDGGSTPLHLACGSASGDLRSVRLLLKHGAKLDVLDSRGRTPLHCAIDGGYRAIAVLLAREARALGMKPNRMAKELRLAQERG